MADILTSERIKLPLLAAGQAQKEITHNEALVLIDALLFPVAQAAGINTPPIAPTAGQCWLVGATPSGGWAGMAHMLALWTSAGWRFASLPLGARVAVGNSHTLWTRTASAWQIAATIAFPTAGSTIDAECRASLISLIQALRVAGIIADT